MVGNMTAESPGHLTHRNFEVVKSSEFPQESFEPRFHSQDVRISIKLPESPELLKSVELVVLRVGDDFLLEVGVEISSVVLLEPVRVHAEQALETWGVQET